MRNHEIGLVLNVLKSLYLHFFPGTKFYSPRKIRKVAAKREQRKLLKEVSEMLQVHSNRKLNHYLERIRTDKKVAVKLFFLVNAIPMVEEFGKSANEDYFLFDCAEDGEFRIYPAVFPVENPKYNTASMSDEVWGKLRSCQAEGLSVETEEGQFHIPGQLGYREV